MKACLKALTAMMLATASFSVFADNSHYAIYVDAGSSGSRLHIFQYDNWDDIKDVVPADIKSVKPGLSSFVGQEQNAGKSLKPIFDGALAFLQKSGVDVKTVPVNVLGTAGMRLIKDQKEQQAIYSNVIAYLKTNYPFEDVNAETIPGKMEGLYGWLDVNYLANRFQSHQPTVGSIDMGGGSTQIAFEIQDQKNKNSDDLTTININQQNYTVFSKSFLGLGMDQTRAAMNNDPLAASCYPAGYEFIPQQKGQFNFVNCTGIYTNMIRKFGVVEQVLPERGLPFIAYSGVTYTYQFFGVDKTPDQGIVAGRMNTVCSESWDQIQKEHPGDTYASTYCANGVYINQLLYSAYGLQGYQLTVENQMDGKVIDWTLGAMLYKVVGPLAK